MTETAGGSLDALFVGYEDQENLGLRSIMASAEAASLRTALEPYTPGDASGVLAAVRSRRPKLVGFSIIFQYTLGEFAKLTAALREDGVRAHFTVGGHFPSLQPREVLDALPHVDSVVRHEGELTVIELLRRIDDPGSWSSIRGLAYRRESRVLVNPARPLIEELDELPPPVRDEPRAVTPKVRVASLLASRGCVYDCSFCSIRQFYGGTPGSARRSRSPDGVIDEMCRLHAMDGVNFFIFQDDDFAARSYEQLQWLDRFLALLDETGLSTRIKWKISCRVDDVEREHIERCRERGLIAVYLGVESGSPDGLVTLNKKTTVAQNIAAIETLKEADLAFDMGFMLFEPDSTMDRIQENIDFLRLTASDGSCPVNFCKMLPYAGTPIEARLRREGRLKGTLSEPDYDFLDPRLDWYALLVAKVFRFRNFDQLGLVERLRLALFHGVLERELEDPPWIADFESALRDLTARLNHMTLNSLERMLRIVACRDATQMAEDWPYLGVLAQRQWDAETELQQELDEVLARYSPELLQMYAAEFANRFAA